MIDPITSITNAIEQIKASAAATKLVAVIGTGVSLALTNGKKPELSWKGLIANGFEFGTTKGKISAAQREFWKHQLNSDDIDDILGAAEFMSRKLDAPHGELYARWLEKTFKEIRPESNEMAAAVRALQVAGIPICTLNYDPLLEIVTGLPGITLRETTKVTSWMSRETQAILHLHGSWDIPATCILGIRDYETTIIDEFRDLIQRALSSFGRLLFIGCGDTFIDPNFSALIRWLREQMKAAAPQHYALVTAAEEARRHTDSSWHGFIDPVSYGFAHRDLPGFLLKHFPTAKISEKHPTGTPSSSTSTDLPIRCIDDCEPRPQIFGRNDELEKLVKALIEDKTILVAGGPGMGKTAVAIAALYDPRIVTHFGRRRIFVSLEPATEPRAILAKLVEMLGLPPTGDEPSLLHVIELNTIEEPLAAILDNAETVFEANPSAAEKLLNLLAQIQGLSLAVTMRGVAPPIPGAVQIDDLAKLNSTAARDAFLAVAGEFFRNDADLRGLLEALDGHALSIRLVAAQAIGLPSLRGLRESWNEVRAEILRMSGEEEGRLTSVRASLSLSLNCRRMRSTPLARRLLALLAFLPGGLAEDDVPSLLGDRGTITKARANEAISSLHQLRLVEQRPDHRLRMLTPLRECVKKDVAPLEVDRERLTERYLRLATRAHTIGTEEWETYREDVEGEADNLDAVCELVVTTDLDRRGFTAAVRGLLKLCLFSGRVSTASAEQAIAKYRSRPPSQFVASCLSIQAQIAQRDLNYQLSLQREDEALAIYRRLGNVGGEANCIFGIGQTAMLLSDYETAHMQIEKALALYRRLEQRLGEANSLNILGGIAFARHNFIDANTHLTEALAIASGRDTLCKATALARLAEVALSQSDHKSAQKYVDDALVLFRYIGSPQSEANCKVILGELAASVDGPSNALEWYDEARLLYQRVGDIGGEARSTIKLGKVQQRVSGYELGLSNIKAGFDLYFKVASSSDLALPGWQALHRALTCSDQTESQRYRELARSHWMALGLMQLIFEWIDSA
jgi:tetratricopeptide (TPR) repeat protein